MSLIQELREIGNVSFSVGYYDSREKRENILDLLWGKKVVERTFEDYSRWSNYETKIYEIEEENETAYFLVGTEIPATESQDGMDLYFEIFEVEPYEVTVTKYKQK